MKARIIEEHDEALRIWNALKIRDRRSSCIVHFDSHSDMALPERGEISIGSFIIPAFLSGAIHRCIWVKHPECREFKEGRYEFKVGHNDEHELKTTCKEIIFCQDYSNEDSLVWSDTNVVLDVVNFENLPSLKIDEQVILDIDLDFFSCKNPAKHRFIKSYGAETYKSLEKRVRKISKRDDLAVFEKELLLSGDLKLAKEFVKGEGYAAFLLPELDFDEFEIEKMAKRITSLPVKESEISFCVACKSVSSGYTPEDKWEKILENVKFFIDDFDYWNHHQA